MRRLPTVILCLCLAGTANAQSLLDRAKGLLDRGGQQGGILGGGGLTEQQIVDGLKEALAVGTRTVVANLGGANGFFGDPVAHIPLPPTLARAQQLMQPLGMGHLGEEVELRMNRGAEAAMSDAGQILGDAIAAMTLEDARGILDGPEDAATQYLRRTSGPTIEGRLRPVIDDSLRQAGAIAALDDMMAGYDRVPFAPNVTASLTDHATGLAMDGLFHYLAEEEAAIRRDPAKRTTELLQRVFAR